MQTTLSISGHQDICAGTVRNPTNEAKTNHLRALGSAFPGKLHLHAADLLQTGSFDEVVR